MKLTKKILFLVLICLLVLTPVCLATNTDNSAKENTVTNEKTEDTETNSSSKDEVLSFQTTNTDYFVTGQDVELKNIIVNGNAFAFGTNVTVKGQILGDLFVFGSNNVTIEENASISGNVFAFSTNIVIKGKVNYSVYAFSTNFELAENGTVGRDLRLYSSQVTLNGYTKQHAYIMANKIVVDENAKDLIGGTLHYSSSEESSIPEELAKGGVQFTKIDTTTPSAEQIISSYISNYITTISYALVVIILATFFAPKFIERANTSIMKHSFACATFGILGVILIPAASFMLLVSGFLTYLGIALLAVFALILSITLSIFSLAIAKWIEKKIKQPTKLKFILIAFACATVLWLLQLIPTIGGYISLFIFVVGLGVFLRAFFYRKEENIEAK